MKKPFLLIAGYGYYPSRGTEDWIGCYESYEEALSQVEIKTINIYYSRGPNKGNLQKTIENYIIKNNKLDWYDIVDLREWTD